MFISIANPYHMQDVPMIETFINAYTANEFNVEMLVKKINGESSFKGKTGGGYGDYEPHVRIRWLCI